MSSGRSPLVSIVLPCLDEERSLPAVLERARSVSPLEVIVVDNGSTDRSVEIAERFGARVIRCEERGYGAALRAGILAAKGEVVAFADADATYDLAEVPKLVAELERGADLVLGSRIRGRIEDGAMPASHRYLGTPVLSALLTALHSPRGGPRIADCNSGFRCFRRSSFLGWDVRSTGMELASEMLVKALRAGARVSEVPITLSPGSAERTPHLRRWRDGTRHLLVIFSESPEFFHATGLALALISWVIIVAGLADEGPVDVGRFSVLGVHTAALALLGTHAALALWAAGLMLSAAGKRPVRLWSYRAVLELPEARLFWGSVAFVAICAALLAAVVGYWALSGFRGIALEETTIAGVTFATNGIFLLFAILTAHLVRVRTTRS